MSTRKSGCEPFGVQGVCRPGVLAIPFRVAFGLATLAVALGTSPARAGFSGTDIIIPAVARSSGLYGSEFYSTIWITNLSQNQTPFTAAFYQQSQSNPTPRTFSDALAPGETRRYDNVVETLFGLPGTAGAVRVTASESLLVTSRTYDLPASGRDGRQLRAVLQRHPREFRNFAG